MQCCEKPKQIKTQNQMASFPDVPIQPPITISPFIDTEPRAPISSSQPQLNTKAAIEKSHRFQVESNEFNWNKANKQNIFQIEYEKKKKKNRYFPEI